MNEINNESKNAAIKTLAIIGFVGVIVLCVWLAVQVVRILPTAFSSLASIAESINANRPTQSLEIESEKRVINSNQSFTLNWVDLKREGTYTFTYMCADGISVDIRFPDESLMPVDCEDGVTIEKGLQTIDVFVSSEKQRFTDVAYTLAFVETGTDTALFERNGKITVVNASIPVGGAVAVTPAPAPEVEPETPALTPTPTPAPKPTPVPTPTPKPITRTVSYVPVSDPNGYTDLRATVLAVGEMSGKTFIPKFSSDNDERGAIQIEVKNFGTKTSEDWNFSIKLPDGSTYTLDKEIGLKPNERSILTIGFDAEDLKGSKVFTGTVTVSKDILTANNSFAGSMTFAD